MTPYRVTFESPLELSAQGECLQGWGWGKGWETPAEPAIPPGKQMIETYFDFRMYRLWKSRQHSKLLDLEDVL